MVPVAPVACHPSGLDSIACSTGAICCLEAKWVPRRNASEYPLIIFLMGSDFNRLRNVRPGSEDDDYSVVAGLDPVCDGGHRSEGGFVRGGDTR